MRGESRNLTISPTVPKHQEQLLRIDFNIHFDSCHPCETDKIKIDTNARIQRATRTCPSSSGECSYGRTIMLVTTETLASLDGMVVEFNLSSIYSFLRTDVKSLNVHLRPIWWRCRGARSPRAINNCKASKRSIIMCARSTPWAQRNVVCENSFSSLAVCATCANQNASIHTLSVDCTSRSSISIYEVNAARHDWPVQDRQRQESFVIQYLRHWLLGSSNTHRNAR